MQKWWLARYWSLLSVIARVMLYIAVILLGYCRIGIHDFEEWLLYRSVRNEWDTLSLALLSSTSIQPSPLSFKKRPEESFTKFTIIKEMEVLSTVDELSYCSLCLTTNWRYRTFPTCSWQSLPLPSNTSKGPGEITLPKPQSFLSNCRLFSQKDLCISTLKLPCWSKGRA